MDASLDHLANVVRHAVDGFADKHKAWADILHWPVEAVKKNPGHARDLVTMTMARNAVVHHLTSPPAPTLPAPRQPSRPQPRSQQALPPRRSRPPNAWDQAMEGGKTWVGQGLQNLDYTIHHPIQATAKSIAKNRVVHTGNAHLDRAVDIIGGADADALAHLIYGPAEIADLAIKNGPGKLPFVETAIKHGVLKPGRPLADRAYDVAAPLNQQAALRPPTTIPGKIVAATPTATAVLAAPLLVGVTYAGVDGVASAYARTRKVHAPAGAKTDAGIIASGVANAAAATLQLRALFGPEAARVIDVMPEQMRGKALDWVWRTAVKSGLGGTIGGAHQSVDNAIAKATYDPRRAPLEGVGTSALMGGVTAAPFGLRRGSSANGHADLPDPLPGIVLNRAVGKQWEADGAELHLSPVQHSLQPQPMIVSLGPSGGRTRVDFLGIDTATGQPKLSEMKSSATARLTKNQRIVFPELETYGGRLVGKAKSPYQDEKHLPPIKVDIYRKPKP